MKELEDLKQKAARFLRTAELSYNDGDYDSCVSRCYYGMFFMAEALLLTKNITASTHKGVIALFGEHFVKTKLIDKELGKALRRAYDLRQKGDYSTGFIVSENEAKEILLQAKEFIGEIEKHL
jgi:uncharacterized protein (UPF0332 family)